MLKRKKDCPSKHGYVSDLQLSKSFGQHTLHGLVLCFFTLHALIPTSVSLPGV